MKRKLIGGTHDGETHEMGGWLRGYMVSKRVTMEEDKALWIDGVIAYRRPDEVYALKTDGAMHYVRTVHYDPAGFNKDYDERKGREQ